MNKTEQFEELILETLSFFDEMNKEQIYLEIDNDKLANVGHVTVGDLDHLLKSLIKRKKVKLVKRDGEHKWIKIFPKRSLWSRFLRYCS